MNIKTLLQDYAAYNLWANNLVADWLRPQSPELLTRHAASSFSSLHDTLLHIWGAQDIWLIRLEGGSPTRFISADFTGTTAEVLDGLLANSLKFKEFVAGQTSTFFEQKSRYLHRNGNTYEEFNAQIIQHCLQHSTYHRGQIVTIGRSLGLTDPPATDFIAYVRLQNT